MANPFEQPQERIYTEEEIIDLIAPYLRCANILPELTRIKKDAKGIYFYEVRVNGEKSNEYSEYVFLRKR